MAARAAHFTAGANGMLSRHWISGQNAREKQSYKAEFQNAEINYTRLNNVYFISSTLRSDK